MSERTGIQWCDHTFNPVWGCTRVSEGCRNCYADRLAHRFKGGLWGPKARRRTFGNKHWAEPRNWDRRANRDGVNRKVFCGSMCDIFEDHPTTAEQLPRLRKLIDATPHLTWLLLTKRPERIGNGWNHPRIWLGTSVEDQPSADLRIRHLLQTPAAVRFVSIEPMLGSVSFRWAKWHDFSSRERNHWHLDGIKGLDWVIVGGESGHGARPFDIQWARDVRDQCKTAGVPFFMKQITEKGRKVPYEAWPEDLKVREYPCQP